MRCALPRPRSAVRLPKLALPHHAGPASPAFVPLVCVPIEDVPRGVYADNAAVVKFRADVRVTLAVKFVPRRKARTWGKGRAAVQNVLAIFDLDISGPGL